jgi:hypothetical protein
MLRSLIVFTVLLAITQTPVPASGKAPDNDARKAGQPQNQTTSSQTKTADTGAIPQTPQPSHPESKGSEERTTNNQDSVTITERGAVPNKRDWFDVISLGVGIILAVITGAGVIAAWRGLPVLKSQAGAARDAAIAAREGAEATLKQANIAMNAERAWVTVKILQPDPKDVRIWEQSDLYALGIPVHLENIGKTPARITDSYVRHIFVEAVDPNSVPAEPSLPEIPDYTADREPNRIIPKDGILMPNQTYDFLITLRKELFEPHMADFKIANKLLCVYGFVRYESLGKKRETRFSYVYLFNRPMGSLANQKTGELFFPPAYCAGGPPEYNKAT